MKKLWLIIKTIFVTSKKVTDKIISKEKTQLELYQQFGEEVLLDSGFPLENVYIKPAYDNKNGIIFRKRTLNIPQFKANILSTPYNYSNKFDTFTTYMILPEIVDLNTLCVWIHEIGHYMQGHLSDERPVYIHEYEAEMYAATIMRMCPIEKGPTYNPEYTLHIHNIHLKYYLICAQNYIKSYIKDSMEVTDNNIINFLNKEFDYKNLVY